MIYFLTGSAGKFREIKAIMPEIEQLKLDLAEIQSLSSQAVIEHKLAQAATLTQEAFFVEDTSLVFHCLNNLPGTFVKWFEQSLGLAGEADLVGRYQDHSATATTMIGYRDQEGNNHYFEGQVHGTIVSPRGGGFGWDAIFVPRGYDKTFGELGIEIKNTLS
ncbi:MAG TPA: non-canonical purine NTP pyrophosphatase, partial [Candidatus Saccharimonadia bacterium]|nr:non-canonical purine NTP pyrophosphatase [Candidatus Saccharimonadia bacterium]